MKSELMMQSAIKTIKKSLGQMSVEWLAKKMNVREDFLWLLSRDTAVMYKPTRPQKKSGGSGYREIDAPKKKYKPLLRNMAKILSAFIPPHPAAHGGVIGRSSFTSARRHCGAKFITTRDIKDCYPSLTQDKLFRALLSLGASLSFAKFLSAIMTVHGRVPQGGHLSSLAVNLYFARMDEHFTINSIQKHGVFTRLADDFVVSAPNRQIAIKFGNEIDQDIFNRGLKINEKKREKRGLLAGDSIKEIHSLVVNSRRGVRPKSDHLKKALGLATYYTRFARSARPEDVPYLADLRGRVAGMMYYFRQAEFSPANHILRMLYSADLNVLRMLTSKGLYPYKNKWWIVNKTRNEPERLLRQWNLKKCLCFLDGKKSA
ncbi:MAG: reverse transcriptase domain-containing protein [Sedimentisphaerales bacterium]